jgi:homogentisate phytyltransferase / homogentisate geranylgeranyltransferase
MLLQLQLGFWSHMRGMSGIADVSIMFICAYMGFFSLVIALFKDIPDVRGDALHGNKTASVRLGVPNVFWTCIGLLLTSYAFAVWFILFFGGQFRILVAACEAVLGGMLFFRARKVNLKSGQEIVSAYMFVWQLFYAQYLLFPMIAHTLM